MMQYLVSVLIPVYNREDFIGECIESALAQTYAHIEVVVVDNASTDGTWEICQQFAAKDPRVRVFRNDTNIGPVRNWIRCAEEAKGRFSKILFSDDLLESDCLKEMVPKLDESNVSLVYCAARIGESRTNAEIAYLNDESSVIKPAEFLNRVLIGVAPVSPGAILFRTSDLLKNLHTEFPTSTSRPFEKHGAGPDVMISLLTSESYSFVANVAKPLVYFRAHAGSFTTGSSNNQVMNGYRSIFSYYLIKRFSRKSWMVYLGYSWLCKMKSEHKWVNPKLHLLEYEGVGSLSEILGLFIWSTWCVMNYVMGKKLRFLTTI